MGGGLDHQGTGRTDGRLFVCSFARSFVRSFIHSLVRSFVRSFVHSFVRVDSLADAKRKRKPLGANIFIKSVDGTFGFKLESLLLTVLPFFFLLHKKKLHLLYSRNSICEFSEYLYLQQLRVTGLTSVALSFAPFPLPPG